jgi:predicted dinucleotide-binding enzyme
MGSGNIGATLARKYVEAGHQVKLANSRGPSTLAAIIEGTAIEAVPVEAVVKDVDVVIISIPLKNVSDLSEALFSEVADDVVIIDTCNYYPSFRDGTIAEIEAGMPESVWVSKQIGRGVVKAFNNIFAQSLAINGRPSGAPGRIALPIAGDSADAKRIVSGLVDEAGFDAVDAGSLEESWRQEPGTPVYSTDYDVDGVRERLARADKAIDSERRARRDRCVEGLIALGASANAENLVQLARTTYES